MYRLRRANRTNQIFCDSHHICLTTFYSAYGSLTVRSLLDTREHCMEEFHFVDPYSQVISQRTVFSLIVWQNCLIDCTFEHKCISTWWRSSDLAILSLQQKQLENEQALKLLADQLQRLDAASWDERQLQLARGFHSADNFHNSTSSHLQRLIAPRNPSGHFQEFWLVTCSTGARRRWLPWWKHPISASSRRWINCNVTNFHSEELLFQWNCSFICCSVMHLLPAFCRHKSTWKFCILFCGHRSFAPDFMSHPVLVASVLCVPSARPWLFDDFDKWKERLKGPPHRCAVVFVDNSGIDIILGIFPLTRELLNRGTNVSAYTVTVKRTSLSFPLTTEAAFSRCVCSRIFKSHACRHFIFGCWENYCLLHPQCFWQVILCANSRPALNDVTYNELTVLTKRVAALSEDISAALSQGRLLVMESGQGSPCLDLRYNEHMLSEGWVRAWRQGSVPADFWKIDSTVFWVQKLNWNSWDRPLLNQISEAKWNRNSAAPPPQHTPRHDPHTAMEINRFGLVQCFARIWIFSRIFYLWMVESLQHGQQRKNILNHYRMPPGQPGPPTYIILWRVPKWKWRWWPLGDFMLCFWFDCQLLCHTFHIIAYF